MVNHTAFTDTSSTTGGNSSDDDCPFQNDTTTSSTKDGPFEWDSDTRGWMLSSFFYGYFVTQIPGGWFALVHQAFFLCSAFLAERYGGRRVFGAAMLASSVFTLLLPVSAVLSKWLFLLMRILVGMGNVRLTQLAIFDVFQRASSSPRATRCGQRGRRRLNGPYSWRWPTQAPKWARLSHSQSAPHYAPRSAGSRCSTRSECAACCGRGCGWSLWLIRPPPIDS